MKGIALLPLLLAVLISPAFADPLVPTASSDERGTFEDRPPEGLFQRIVTAHGEEMVMGQFRSFQIVPVKPTDTFSADVPEVFVVFQVHRHYNPYQVFGRWYVEQGEGVPPNHLLGTDAMYLALEDESGYVSLKRPSTGWPVGQYKIEIHIGMKISEISLVGTMRVKVVPANTAS